MTNVSSLPGNISLNLDDLERESVDAAGAKRKPFVIQVGGRTIEMTDPSEIDWKDLLEIENPVYFLKYALSDEVPAATEEDPEPISDKAFFKKQGIPGWKLGHLIEGYIKHYGLDQQGNVAASRI